MAAIRRHMGVTTHRAMGYVTVHHRGMEIGRVNRTYHDYGGHVAAVRVGATVGYKRIGSFPTHNQAVSAIARSASHRTILPVKTPKLKRPMNSPFKRRTHPTQSLGAV